VQLVAAIAPAKHESGRFEHGQVLGDRLACRAESVLGREPRADLEQRLVIALAQLVEDGSAGGIGERFEDIVYGRRMIGK
jgi:hypothetical protein